MDSDREDNTQRTLPATQKALDPRRLGQQNSGFSDEDLSDIICFLVPNSDYAREQVGRIRQESSLHIVPRDNVEQTRLNYDKDDDPDAFKPTGEVEPGPHAIVLRLSADVKDAAMGFTFGRNSAHCDITFSNDPLRRLSNVHFRIYLNEYGVLMLEDQSTNGTVVDERLLKKKSGHSSDITRTLNSGSIIKVLMHKTANDLNFLVRIPRREGQHGVAYRENLIRYLNKLTMLNNDAAATIVPGLEGPIDLFPAVPQRRPRPTAARRPATPELISHHTLHLSGHGGCWTESSKYQKVCEIGRGAFATVYQVTSRYSGKPYAAKELDKRKFMKNGTLDHKVENEMKIMELVEHDNIVKFIDKIDWDNKLLVLIMELVPGGDLGKLISGHGHLTEEATITMTRQLTDALDYLHNNNVTHRDVKPDNILIASHHPFMVKLTDFGLSKLVDTENTALKTFCGTLLYCAPEVYAEYAEYDDLGQRNPRNRRRQPRGQRYDHAVDIWSLGGVLFYALTAEAPFPARNGIVYTELLRQIMTTSLDISRLKRRSISDEGIEFVSRMLDRRPEKRATAKELLQHPWLADAEYQPSQEFQQLSLEDEKENIRMDDALEEQSDDEVLDDRLDDEEDNDSFAYESEKENTTFGPRNPPRLFGEVAGSAIGSSGVMPSRLHLPVPSVGELQKSEIESSSKVSDSFESENSSTLKETRRSPSMRTTMLISEPHRNLGCGSPSPSLGGAGSILENLNMKSLGSRLASRRSDLGASKRKPYDTGDEVDGDFPCRPVIKKVRSEGLETSGLDLCDQDLADMKLWAQIPCIKANCGRQIDNPVHKAAYWSAENSQTWHLDYPEMTQLQLDAFEAAAGAREEIFGPGSSLWELAVEHFPAHHYREASSRRRRLEMGQKSSAAEPGSSLPSTLPPDALESQACSLPDTQTGSGRPEASDTVQTSESRRAVAHFESDPESAVKGISVRVTESMVSWGRAKDNTREHMAKNDIKVPKYGFKLLLWKNGFHPGKDPRPWIRRGVHDESSFHFYISTKASRGIGINGVSLPSYDYENPTSPSKNWMRLHHNDQVDVWYDRTTVHGERTRLTFNCFWGGSALPRPYSDGRISAPRLEPDDIARMLDDALSRAEKRLPELQKYDQKMEDATIDAKERRLTVDRERERSRLFEAKRQEAVRVLAIHKQKTAQRFNMSRQGSASRRDLSRRPSHVA